MLDDEVVRRLDDAVGVVVAGREHRSGDAAREAAVPHAHVQVVVAVVVQVVLLGVERPLPDARTPVGRVDDERRLPRRQHRVPRVEPVAAVAADVASRLVAPRRGGVARLLVHHALLVDGGDLLVGQERASLHVGGPLDGGQGLVAPHALEVGLAVGGTGHRPVGIDDAFELRARPGGAGEEAGGGERRDDEAPAIGECPHRMAPSLAARGEMHSSGDASRLTALFGRTACSPRVQYARYAPSSRLVRRGRSLPAGALEPAGARAALGATRGSTGLPAGDTLDSSDCRLWSRGSLQRSAPQTFPPINVLLRFRRAPEPGRRPAGWSCRSCPRDRRTRTAARRSASSGSSP